MIIKESDIEKVFQSIDKDPNVGLKWLDAFNETLKDYRIYLDEEVLKLLSEAERDVLLFIQSSIFHILSQKEDNLRIDLPSFFDQEEKNWNIYESLIREPFNERLNPFFDLYDEEEGLAFIEDCLTKDPDDEKDILSAPGRDIIWNVSCAFLVQLCKQYS